MLSGGGICGHNMSDLFKFYKTQDGVCYDEPGLKFIKDQGLWELMDMTCWVYKDILIKVPVGFLTDIASVPQIFHTVFKPYGKHNRAAIIHDYLYKFKGNFPGYNYQFTRVEADRIFLDIMKVDGVSWFFRNTMYLAVKYYNIGAGW